jgi:hypothetical protein
VQDAVEGERAFDTEQRELLGNPKEITKAWLFLNKSI